MQKTIVAATLLSLALVATPAPAQETNTFRLKIGTVMTGTEEYRTAKTADGYQVAGKLHTETAGNSIDLTHDETLAPDRTLVRYKAVAGGVQTIEAWRDGDNIQMKVAVGAQQQTKTVAFTMTSVVVDNMVSAHFQVVLDRIAGSTESSVSLTFVVPQVLLAIPGTVTRGAEEAATLDGKPIKVRKYLLQVANVLEELWADSATNRLMRYSVPMQKVECVREGFVPALVAEPPQSGPVTFVERSINVANASVTLPGTLCLPAKVEGKVPVLVLVHGSGPNDRDETIGPNKPFRDLARGLAAAGIATLRYDKRTFLIKEKKLTFDPKTFTVEDEVLADSVAAVALARSLPEIDSARVFVLGHSLGATLGPFIADRATARGAILMAPAERPLDQVIPEQVAFQSKVAGQTNAEIAAQDGELKRLFGRVRSGEAKEDEMVFGASAHYWRDLMTRDTRAALASTKVPVLLLQGGRDVQVVKTDYDLALQALASKAPAMREAHWFPKLNHLFLEAPENPTGAEYGIAGHVPAEVVQIIATWVQKQK